MGAGNYLPPRDETYPYIFEDFLVKCDPVYEMVYVRSTYEDGFDDTTARSVFEANLKHEIDRLLPRSFEQRERWGWQWRNQVLHVYLKGEYHDYYPLFITPTQPLGIRHMEMISRRLFDGLAVKGYRLSVRTGPWTSGTYTVSSAGKLEAAHA